MKKKKSVRERAKYAILLGNPRTFIRGLTDAAADGYVLHSFHTYLWQDQLEIVAVLELRDAKHSGKRGK